MSKVYLGLGSNLGDREENMRKAIQLIGERVGKVTKQSSFIETDPWGYESANRFLNAVILCETSKKPREVLLLTQQRIDQANKELDKLVGVRSRQISRRLSAVESSADPVTSYFDGGSQE